MFLQARTAASAGARADPVPLAPRSAPAPAPAGSGRPRAALVVPVILAGLIVVAAVLRFSTLTSQSYWLDESQAAHEVGLSFAAMLRAWSSAEWNPPLYLIIAWPWAKLFGNGEGGLRSLSALLGVGLVPLMYLCGRELVSRRAGVAAAALAAVNPFMIYYSQEAREYMLLVVLCTASLLFFARAWRTRAPRDLVWWAVLSGLALLTQYFAGFLIAAEGLLLVYRLRNRASLLALLSQAVVLAPFIPHAIPQLQNPAEFIVSQPLGTRIQQVPVSFALATMFKGPAVRYGLIGAAVACAVVIVLLILGGDDRELRGAGIAAALAAVVLLVPLGLALVGHDDYIYRGLMPAWPPLALVFAAACTARRARLAGAVLGATLVALFVYGLVTISGNAFYQRPDWRGVAAALGKARATRAIVAYDNQFATGPLSFYLPGVPWAGPGEPAGTDAGPQTIGELDVIGGSFAQPVTSAAGARLIGVRRVDGYQIARYALTPAMTAPPPAIAARAQQLMPEGQQPAVIIQHVPA